MSTVLLDYNAPFSFSKESDFHKLLIDFSKLLIELDKSLVN